MGNNFYKELCSAIESNSMPSILEWMANCGQSVILNWGEDTGNWECSWITGGKRFTTVRAAPISAIKAVLESVKSEILLKGFA